MLKAVAKLVLWLIGAAFPLLIAACYGGPAGFSRTGKVLDQATKKGISGLKVSCLIGGQAAASDYTALDGSFNFYGNDCDSVLVEDVDGANNGSYASKTTPFCETCPSVSVELAAK